MSAAVDVAALARALLPRAVSALRTLSPDDRGPSLAAIDGFLAEPGPASFLRAARLLREAQQAGALAKHGRGSLDRLLAEGAVRLKAVPGLPAPIASEIIATLPLDARAGRRLAAVAMLLETFEELQSRVATDTAEMRQRLLPSARRASQIRNIRPSRS
ncbi:MAG TPA: hypothetical protein VGG33_12945 [Polyangia bacterium]